MDNHKDLSVSHFIQAPCAAVWLAWEKPEYLARWWAPSPIQTTVHQLELRPGGAFNSTMRMEDGSEFGGEACFLDVVKHERIVWTSALQGGWRPNKDDMPFTAIITMEQRPGGTQYTATAMHQNDEDRKKHADMGFVDGWTLCIRQLDVLAQQLA